MLMRYELLAVQNNTFFDFIQALIMSGKVIVSQISKIVLDVETGDISRNGSSGKVRLTGVPLMLSERLNATIIHYRDHIDRVRTSFNKKGESAYISEERMGDTTYLGQCYISIGWHRYHKVGNDLICYYGNDRIANVKFDFFLGCKLFLYMSNPRWRPDNTQGDDDFLPHYIDLNGVYHGRNSNIISKMDKYGMKFNILFDVRLCIFNEYEEIYMSEEYNHYYDDAFDQLCKLEIQSIDIYPDVCRIFAEDGVYVLDKNGLQLNGEFNFVCISEYSPKSANKV